MNGSVSARVSKAEIEAEGFFGKAVLLLSEEREMELSLLARLLYTPYRKVYYWLVKRGLWNDCITIKKRDKRVWVSLGGPFRCWLAATYSLVEPEPSPEFGNEIFKRIVSVKEARGTIYAFRLRDGSILMVTFNRETQKFLFHIQLRPGEVLANGEVFFRLGQERIRKAIVEAVSFLGLATYPNLATWLFETIHVVKIRRDLLEQALKGVTVIPEEQL